MNTEDFNTAVGRQIDRSRSILQGKNDNYATNADKLEQFKLAAKIQNITPKEALGGMMVKHTTSVYAMINDGVQYSQEEWDEKIGDHINYLLLLSAMVEEEISEARSKIQLDVNSMYSMYPAKAVEDILADKEQYLKPAESFKSNITFQGEDDAV